MLPPQPLPQVPGVPPIAPGGYAPPIQAAPPAPPQGHNPYAGADKAAAYASTPNLPLGTAVLEFVRYERTNTQSGLEMTFVTFKVVETDNPSVRPGSECSVKQNMNPSGKGGRNIAFGALKSLFFPLIGYSFLEPSHKAHVETLCNAGKFSEWLFELETRGTVAGQSLVGRKVHLVAQPGVRKPNTPADKEPFPKLYWSPMAAPLA